MRTILTKIKQICFTQVDMCIMHKMHCLNHIRLHTDVKPINEDGHEKKEIVQQNQGFTNKRTSSTANAQR